VIIDIVHKVKRVRFNLITLPSHTSHVLQPLDVTCFKPFKTAFRAYKGVWIFVNKAKGVSKENLAHWVSLALKKTLSPQNICEGFKTIGIWPLDPSPMESKMQPNEKFV